MEIYYLFLKYFECYADLKEMRYGEMRYNEKITFKDNKGRFVKPCPGTPRHVCCGYKIIDFAHGCTIGCRYCILTHYFNENYPVVFKNLDRLLIEVEEYIDTYDGFIRFGTGEFTDSLLFEGKIQLYEKLIPLIEKSSNSILEIKTKTANIKNILKIKPHSRIMVSWSMNTDYIWKTLEPGAVSIDRRIEAARILMNEDYKLGFHFDPIIIYNGWEEDYINVIERIFKSIDSDAIVYISLGALRFIPEMLEIESFRNSFFVTGEFVRGQDNKMRYFRPIRVKLYRTLKKIICNYFDESRLYMCMESKEVWEDVFGIKNMDTTRLSNRLDRACFKVFGFGS